MRLGFLPVLTRPHGGVVQYSLTMLEAPTTEPLRTITFEDVCGRFESILEEAKGRVRAGTARR